MAKSINRLMAELINDDGDVKLENLDEAPRGLDSAAVDNIAQDAAIAVYDSLGLLPITGLTAGDQAYVSSNTRLYVSNGSGWYNVALINLTPTMSLDQSGTVVLSTEGVATTVTITAQDSDNPDAILSYSVESDGNGIGNYTLSQDSSVFTITPLTEDSGAANSTFTLTFKTTDNINTATSDLNFNLTFSNLVDSSSPTILLLKASGNDSDNSVITYEGTSSGSSVTFTRSGAAQAATVTPYRSGGYSTYFDGTGDRLEIDSPIGDLSDSDYTIEGWYYFLEDPNSNTKLLWTLNDDGGNGYAQLQTLSSTTTLRLQQRGGSHLSDGTFDFDINTWYHIATVWDGTNMKVYVNGAEALSSSTNVVQNAGNGLTVNGDGGGNLQFNGYIKDFRIVKGSAVYTSTFTPPTEPLAAITGTDVLLCHAPYIVDGSSNDYTVVVGGTPNTQPFSPYDYTAWADSDGGSVYFNGGSKIETPGDVNALGTGSYTFEAWARFDNTASANETVMEWNDATTNVTSSRIIFGRKSTGVPRLYLYSADKTISSPTMLPNVWYHMALVRNGSTTKVYINGKEEYTQADTQNASNLNRLRIGRNRDNAEPMSGHVADLRYTTDARYTAEFTPQTAPLTHTTNQRVRMDNKTNAKIFDAAAVHSFRFNGDPKSSTTQRKFTTSSSVYFDGSDQLRFKDGLLTPSEFGTDDWTIEAWIYSTSSSAQYVWGDVATSGSNNTASHFLLYNSTGITAYNYTTQNNTLTGSEATAANTWHHIAVTREGDTFRLFVNGVLDTSATNSDAMNNSSINYAIGGVGDYDSKFTGYIQDFRITKGKARYTATFTPPTAEFVL